jgi:ABC-type enterochelin transport system permease subunit
MEHTPNTAYTYLLLAFYGLVMPLLREIFFGQELLATLEVAVGGVFVLLRDTVGQTVAYLSDLVHAGFSLASVSSPT